MTNFFLEVLCLVVAGCLAVSLGLFFVMVLNVFIVRMFPLLVLCAEVSACDYPSRDYP